MNDFRSEQGQPDDPRYIGGIEMPQGGNFFLPYALKELEISGKGRVILIRPPRVS